MPFDEQPDPLSDALEHCDKMRLRLDEYSVPWPEHVELVEEEARRTHAMPVPAEDEMPYELADPLCMLEASVAEGKERLDSWEALT